LIELCQEIFSDCNLDDSLWLKPYRIVSTGPAAGFVETLPNTLSIDAIKKTDNFISLPHFFQSLYGTSGGRLNEAKKNFVSSLAAYSLVCYVLQIRDRHNGNILIDKHGHIIHIDFGFLLGIAPGGSFSIESAPFKLTEEMLDVFGGIDSDMFSEFVKAFTQGFLALRSKSTAILSAVSLIASDSSFPCFQGKEPSVILDKLRQRFKCELSSSDAIEHCLELIIQSYSNLGTRQYDSFQWYTNGIIP
jgi:phosphatidylinositol kinase/protein kinase (PI-3  family)